MFSLLVVCCQIYEAPVAAGCLPALVYARIDPGRFTSVYSAKGRWSLIEDLTAVPVSASSSVIAARPLCQPLQQQRELVGKAHMQTRAAWSLEAVQHIVREAAASVLGIQPEGGHLTSRVTFGMTTSDQILLQRI